MTQPPNPYQQYFPQAQPAPAQAPAAPPPQQPWPQAAPQQQGYSYQTPNPQAQPFQATQLQQPWPQAAPQFAAPPPQQPWPQAAPQQGFAPQGGGYSLNQAAAAPDDLSLLPEVPGPYLVAVVNFQDRNSQSQGSFGGETTIATFQILRPGPDPKYPAGTQCTRIWRKGQAGNSGRGYGVVKDAKRRQQFVAAVYALDPNDLSQNWDQLEAQLKVRNWQAQPCVLEMRLSDSGKPRLDKNTRQPTGKNWLNELYLPAPPPGGPQQA